MRNKKEIEYQGHKVLIKWDGRLKPHTELNVYTADAGLAMAVVPMFLKDMNCDHLIHTDGWPGSDKVQFMKLKLAKEEDDDEFEFDE